MHAIEKILARNSGKESVKTGKIVTAKVDFAEINDLYFAVIADSNFASVCAVIGPAGDDPAMGEVNHADAPP